MNTQNYDSCFTALDEDGNEHILYVSLDRIETSQMLVQDSLSGNGNIQLANGTPVNYVSKGTYKTLLGQKLKSTDPQAP